MVERANNASAIDDSVDNALWRAFEVWSWTLPVNRRLPFNELPLDAEYVRTRAYYKYVARGRRSGYELDDWLTAESELRELFAAFISHQAEMFAAGNFADPEGVWSPMQMNAEWEEPGPNRNLELSDGDGFLNPNLQNRLELELSGEEHELLLDHRGVAWFANPVSRSSLPESELRRALGEYRILAVRCQDDVVFALGDNPEDLIESLEEHDLDVGEFALEPTQTVDPRI
ncbi:MAG: DUF2934 domain-containing protein [Planctomycetales bacterium]|nr:DUF2934 domain-containing protein [Planctomycetales bacterium]